ncbi:hypothetical protein SAMN05428959_1011151 [Duganella sp. CF517]|uniref:hypothetical protein n=1 Tax=Duganella sp. CF517 TaxID=1881038 RepID=UPI0008D25C20|nr:hypothetical protein [Duganella sp. CF517]SEN31792.1 hypothetical protein SAMN05428959_1011151 [Duganella sp. CF517]
MSVQHQAPGQSDCPQCIVNFYAFFVAVHKGEAENNPIVRDHVGRVVACSARRGFTLAGDLAALVAKGEELSDSALWIATRLGEVVGAELTQSMVDDMIADLKTQQFNPPGEKA